MRLQASLIGGSLLLASCAGHSPQEISGVPPAFELRLSPASLGHELALQQQLSFRFGQERRTLDALLEADPSEVRLEVQSMGQSALRLRWDGKQLEQHRADWLPRALRGEQVLSDLQLANWPIPVIRAALPTGWSLVEDSGSRKLLQGDATVTTVSYPAPNRIDIEHANFSLSIVSVPVQQAIR